MATESQTAKQTPETSTIHILKTATTRSLEGSATLTYLIGEDNDGGIHWKIAENSGGGFFSNEWVAFADIQQAFADWSDDSPITSIVLRPLFHGKSVNTPSFLLAALTAEGLLAPLPKRKRVHQACDPRPFLASLDELRGKGGKKPAKAKAKAPAKAKSAAKKVPPKKKARTSGKKAR